MYKIKPFSQAIFNSNTFNTYLLSDIQNMYIYAGETDFQEKLKQQWLDNDQVIVIVDTQIYAPYSISKGNTHPSINTTSFEQTKKELSEELKEYEKFSKIDNVKDLIDFINGKE